jgi:Raf kinase inhibitor-like YbhB/YbcL family protein
MRLQSTAFAEGQTIPEKHARDGRDTSPPLAWSGVPEGAKSLALLCDDPDAPRATPWVHWVYFDLPPTLSGLPEGVSKDERPKIGGVQGKNDYGDVGWGGPQPPVGHGVHHYHFRLCALDTLLKLRPGSATKDEVDAALRGHVLGEARLMGTYRRD